AQSPAFKIHQAICSGDAEGLKRILAADETPDHGTSHPIHGKTALHLAVDSGRTDLVAPLVLAGADLTKTEKEGNSVLQWAVKSGTVDTLKLLLQTAKSQGLDWTQLKNKAEETLIHTAARRGEQSILAVLLEELKGHPKRIEALSAITQKMESALILACQSQRGEQGVATMLLEQPETHVENLDSKFKTAINYAVDFENPALVKALLAKGANPNRVYQQNDSPLATALKNHDKESVKALLKSGANPNQKIGIAEEPVLFYAQSFDDDLMNALKAKGMKMDGTDRLGNTALHDALVNFEDQVVEGLIRHGAPLNIKNKAGQTPLNELAAWLSKQQTQALPEMDSDIDVNHLSALKICIQLLVAGADPALADSKGFNVVHHLASSSFGPTFLLPVILNNPTNTPDSLGALLNAVSNETHQTPFDVAVQDKNARMVESLVGAGVVFQPEAQKPYIRKASRFLEGLLLFKDVPKMQTKMCQAWLDQGGNPNQLMQNPLSRFFPKSEGTALEFALVSQNEAMIELLLKHPKLNLDQYDESRNTLLERLILEEAPSKAVETVLNAKADPNVLNEFGHTPLFVALQRVNKDYQTFDGVGLTLNPKDLTAFTILESLLKHGALVNVLDERGVTPLTFAMQRGLPPVAIETLLSAGADPQLKFRDPFTGAQRTPLEFVQSLAGPLAKFKEDYLRILEAAMAPKPVD
ncbi:MAG: ankyrin repeat domain-containing protein, partial [Cyanobacteria bacterium]|nr:ankyrin repeat domain-containing protein [Cyanobacteriota bacterium]